MSATAEKMGSVPRGEKLLKAPTGIQGFDEITGGGLPRGRPTLICGGPGSGKTMFGMEFLIHGAVGQDEPGVFMSFEESAIDLAKNVASLGFDLGALIEEKKLAVDHVHIERSEIEETGEYDLDGLFVRLGYAIDSVKARRVVLDTVEALFAALPNEGILRAELRRLFGWLKDRGITAVITGERGEGALTRRGLEEYVSDCVILLDQRVHDQIATRRLRVVKYRGSRHGTNEYPFLIHEHGLSVLPTTSLGLAHEASVERVSMGIPGLDAMLGGRGIYRGSTVLISGTAGSGKSSLSATAAAACCRRGERCLYFAFEESQSQILRNMRSIGVDLAPWVQSGLLRFHVARPTMFGLEMHLAIMHQQIEQFDPQLVITDPITNLISIGTELDVQAMLVRFIDFLKMRQTTGLFTSLTAGGSALERTEVGVSSLMDTWLLVRFIETNGERNRGLYVLKSRGMPHSNQIREYVISERGIELLDVYTGPSGVLTGTARRTQERREQAEALARQQEAERRQRELQRKRSLVAGQIAAMRAELEAEEQEVQQMLHTEGQREVELAKGRDEMARLRQGEHSNGQATDIETNGEGIQ
jgi:circadian clock protein KaiC